MFTTTDVIVALATGIAVGLAMGVFIGFTLTWVRLQLRLNQTHERVKRAWRTGLAAGVKTW